jgi:HipA-like C-terminal domain./HipA-like N-terminal domain.
MSKDISPNTYETATYVYKDNKLYARILKNEYSLYIDKKFISKNDEIDEILDILPEGVDLEIMKRSFNTKNKLELFSYLKNPIGNFKFSKSFKAELKEDIVISNLDKKNTFPNILNAKIDIEYESLKADDDLDIKLLNTQRLSISGYQHKLQVSILDNIIAENYSDYILKSANEYLNLAVNEHMHMEFMRKLGFEVPFNAIVYDERFDSYHYLIKRFDIDENGKKLPQISLNALMREKNKYSGSIDKVIEFLNNKIDENQKTLFLKFIYANALVFNNDLHKKNISFIYKNNKLEFSPIYDVINVFIIKGKDNNQVALPINGKKANIQISYFKNISEEFGLEFNKIKDELLKIRKTYIEEYPKYIELLNQIPHIYENSKFQKSLMNSYEKNLQTFKMEDKNNQNVSLSLDERQNLINQALNQKDNYKEKMSEIYKKIRNGSDEKSSNQNPLKITKKQ